MFHFNIKVPERFDKLYLVWISILFMLVFFTVLILFLFALLWIDIGNFLDIFSLKSFLVVFLSIFILGWLGFAFYIWTKVDERLRKRNLKFLKNGFKVYKNLSITTINKYYPYINGYPIGNWEIKFCPEDMIYMNIVYLLESGYIKCTTKYDISNGSYQDFIMNEASFRLVDIV